MPMKFQGNVSQGINVVAAVRASRAAGSEAIVVSCRVPVPDARLVNVPRLVDHVGMQLALINCIKGMRFDQQ
jgi:hypothetical protein